MNVIADTYRIHHTGQIFVGNVRLVEFRIFENGRSLNLYNVTKVSAHRISRRQADMIEGAAMSFGNLIPEAVYEELKKLNLLANSDRKMREEGSFGRKPHTDRDYAVTRIALFVSQNCNMGCVYCYGDGGVYDGKGMMSLEMARKSVDWLIENSLDEEDLNIGFFGGEPLLNFRVMKEVTKYARERASASNKHIHFSITTNGSLLTDEIREYLKDERIEVLVSFDGPKEYQDKKRPFVGGRGSYDKVVENIGKLKNNQSKFSARATVCVDMEPERVREGMREAGFTSFSLVTVSPADFGGQSVSSNQDIEAIAKKMEAYYERESNDLIESIKNRSLEKSCASKLLGIILKLHVGESMHFGCGVGKGLAGISIRGDIYPCHRFVGRKEYRLGSVGDYKAGNTNTYWESHVDSLPKCSTCWARYLCGGGCFYHNKALTGNIQIPHASYCRQMKSMFKNSINVYCELNSADIEYVRGILSVA